MTHQGVRTGGAVGGNVRFTHAQANGKRLEVGAALYPGSHDQ